MTYNVGEKKNDKSIYIIQIDERERNEKKKDISFKILL